MPLCLLLTPQLFFVEKWVKDKSPIIALLASQMAAFARELPEMYRNLKSILPPGGCKVAYNI
jgi:hypothetical protein